MMKRIFLLIILLTVTFLASARPAIAQGGPEPVYVDPNRTNGNEDGSQSSPYNSNEEGLAYAQSQPNGGWLYVKNQDGTWPATPKYVPPVSSGPGGVSLPDVALYLLLAVLALVLILIGWYFQQCSRQLRG